MLIPAIVLMPSLTNFSAATGLKHRKHVRTLHKCRICTVKCAIIAQTYIFKMSILMYTVPQVPYAHLQPLSQT